MLSWNQIIYLLPLSPLHSCIPLFILHDAWLEDVRCRNSENSNPDRRKIASEENCMMKWVTVCQIKCLKAVVEVAPDSSTPPRKSKPGCPMKTSKITGTLLSKQVLKNLKIIPRELHKHIPDCCIIFINRPYNTKFPRICSYYAHP